jgi:hypothetical protein
MVVQAYNPVPWRLRQEDQEFKALFSMRYIENPCLKKTNKKT